MPLKMRLMAAARLYGLMVLTRALINISVEPFTFSIPTIVLIPLSIRSHEDSCEGYLTVFDEV